jgi:16S rRNA (adenine1518-N6/adenine1519-N6)-dimethyltransferase
MSSTRRTPKLGQHLLTNPHVSAAVADAAGVGAGTVVLEIGPGKGALTKELLKRGARVVAVEKDPAMVAVLKELFADAIQTTQLVLVEEDVRTFFSETLSKTLTTPYIVAANIPYYITGEIIRELLTAPVQPTTVALLVQKEVAERIARSKKESILSLSVKVFGTPKYVSTVKRGNFAPPPKVDSAILAITNISRAHFVGTSEERFFELVKAGFGQKRKTLAGNLKRVFGDSLGVEDKVRAEDVPLAEWLELAKR